MIRIYVHIVLRTKRARHQNKNIILWFVKQYFKVSPLQEGTSFNAYAYLSYNKFIVGMGFSREGSTLTQWNILRETSLFPLVCPNTDMDFYEM